MRVMAGTVARAAGDPRTGGQVRADTLAARITGHDPTTDLSPVRVNLVIGVESLFGEGTEPGLIPGRPSHGCIRLKNRDIERLYELARVGTPLLIK